MENEQKISLFAKIGLFFTAILWGGSLPVMKFAQQTFNTNFLLGIRFTISFLILLVIFHKKFFSSTKKDLINGLIIGVFLFLGYTSQTMGVKYSDPGRCGFITSTYCVIVPFMSWLISKKRPDKFNIIAAVLCLSGIYFMTLSENEVTKFVSSESMLKGDLLAILSAILFASHIVSVGKLSSGRDPIRMTLIQFLMASILSWISTIIFEDNSNLFISSIRPIYEVLYLSILCTTVGLLLQNIGQKYTPDSSVAIIMSFESVFGIIISIILKIEHLTIHSIIGFVLIFLAVIISETKLKFLRKK